MEQTECWHSHSAFGCDGGWTVYAGDSASAEDLLAIVCDDRSYCAAATWEEHISRNVRDGNTGGIFLALDVENGHIIYYN